MTYTEFKENRVIGDVGGKPSESRRVDDRLGQEKVDNRRDPYENRKFEKYGREERLRDLLANERGVERIVRGRTWNVVQGRCLDVEGEWQEGFTRWKGA